MLGLEKLRAWPVVFTPWTAAAIWTDYDELSGYGGRRGRNRALGAEECVNKNYKAQIFDEMIKPTVIVDDDNKPMGKICDNDAAIFFNFRSDRALQLTQAFVSPQVVAARISAPCLQNLYFATMTEYAPGLPLLVAFGPMTLNNNLAEVVSQNRLTQFHIAESEKYAHVTAFFNCGRTEKFPGEERVIVTSPSNNARNYFRPSGNVGRKIG